MYGSRYITYILLHPIRFIKDLNNYINWCIMMDKYKWTNIKKIIVFENLQNTYHYGVYDKLPNDQLNGHILDVFSHSW